MFEEESDNYESKCSCCCIECIEGDHCGGLYIDTDDEGNEEVIGICHNPEALLEGMKEFFIDTEEEFEDDWCDEEYDYEEENDE